MIIFPHKKLSPSVPKASLFNVTIQNRHDDQEEHKKERNEWESTDFIESLNSL